VRVLVIEDDVDVATGVRRCLAADGFDVEVACDGAAGLERVRADRFDLIVLDILLPSMNGYRVCATIRSERDDTPILMLTAKAGEYDEAEGLELGADDYLVKPFSMVVLLARVRALLRRPRRRFERSPVGDFRLDPLRRCCVRGSEPVALTAREMEVLAYLLDRPGEVVRKSELLEGVWGSDFRGDPNIVEVYVGHLRRKLDEPFGRNDIVTVRGQGYRLEVGAST
jgi:DNA-binding response OmpR family regulator